MKSATFLLNLGLLLSLAGPANAYIGPGAGLGAIAVTVALVLGLLLLVVGLVWYPMKRMLKAKKAAKATSDVKDASE